MSFGRLLWYITMYNITLHNAYCVCTMVVGSDVNKVFSAHFHPWWFNYYAHNCTCTCVDMTIEWPFSTHLIHVIILFDIGVINFGDGMVITLHMHIIRWISVQ